MDKLIIGCGYLGRRVAARWLAEGHTVHALTRGRAEELRTLGVCPVVGDVLQAMDLPRAETVLYAAAPDRRGEQGPADVWLTGLGRVLAVVRAWPNPPHFLFVSSTSVYGQTDGEEVDERAATEPLDESGRVLLAAEKMLLQEARPPAVILRFAGMYGPGRLLRRSESLRAAEPLAVDPDGWLNLIHVEDGASAIIAAEALAEPGTVYNVADDRPVRRREFYGLLARLLGVPEPRFAPPTETRGPHRRIVNRRMRSELRVTLQYPTFEEGLPASVP